MNKNYYPLFTRLRSIPFDLNLYLEDINNMSDEEFQEYAEKLRKYVINTYEKHNFPACIIKGRSLDRIIRDFRLFDKTDFSDILLKDNHIELRDKSFTGVNHWFPEMYDVKRQSSNLSVMDPFRDPSMFLNNFTRLVRKDSLGFRKRDRLCKVSDTLSGFRILNGVLPISNFPAGIAKFFFSKILNKSKFSNDKELRILDQSCGWGGRLLGAISASTSGLVNRDLHYNGTDVNIATHDRFQKIIDFWHNKINDNNRDKFHFYKSTTPAEHLLDDTFFSDRIGKYNMSFTSPPYFNTEKYSLDETQSYLMYETYEDWSKNFLRPMIENTYKLLKRNGECFLNIADVKKGASKTYLPLQDDTKRYAESVGFKYQGEFKMIMPTLTGVGTDNKNNRTIGPNLVLHNSKYCKFEPILYFKKG